MSPRLLVVMGSGETSPTMVKTHRSTFARFAEPVRSVLLDSPYGFQENAAQISERIVEYFQVSLGQRMTVASFRLPGAVGSGDAATALQTLRTADFAFAGPGSPSYALRCWRGSEVPVVLGEKLRAGGAVVFASAAALTLGRWTVPVYEIYKVGEDPHWLEGLDLLGEIGINAAVIPHFDNAEGGNHDTRFCYLGARRLEVMRGLLPENAVIIGVDEHTALTFDLDVGRAWVTGLGGVTIITRGATEMIPSGGDLVLSEVGSRPTDMTQAGALDEFHPTSEAASGPFAAGWRALDETFSMGIERRDTAAALESALDLQRLILDWAQDSTQSPEFGAAERALRGMMVRLAEAASAGVRDPRETVGGFVEAVLEARQQARHEQRWREADVLRARLDALGVELHDTPDGTTWELKQP